MAQPQTLAIALANLQNLPARITELQQKGTEFRQVLGTRLTDITRRLGVIRQQVEQQGNTRQELLTLQNQIRDGAPTAAQLQTITNVIAQIDPDRLRQELTALEAEVGALEQAVGINRPPGAPGGVPVINPPALRGGYDSSKQAAVAADAAAILLSRKHSSNKRQNKHNKSIKKKTKKTKKTKKDKRKKKKKTKKKQH